jgi:hypothetical protein
VQSRRLAEKIIFLGSLFICLSMNASFDFRSFYQAKSHRMHTSNVCLTSEQIDKLRRVLNPTIPIYPSPSTSSCPTLHIVPKDFLRQLLIKLKQHEINVSDVRLNGGAASYVLIDDSNFAYRDIDILFCIDTPLTMKRQTTLFASNNDSYSCDTWTIIKYVICSCLIEYMPDIQQFTPKFLSTILDTYTKKNIHITSEHDSWALLSLQNLLGRNLELKFIKHWKRQWQFSVDSFQIDLEPLLFESVNSSSSLAQSITRQLPTMNIQIEAFNAVHIRSDHQTQDISTTPLQFGFFTPSSLSSSALPIITNKSSQTLTTITTVDTLTRRMRCMTFD